MDLVSLYKRISDLGVVMKKENQSLRRYIIKLEEMVGDLEAKLNKNKNPRCQPPASVDGGRSYTLSCSRDRPPGCTARDHTSNHQDSQPAAGDSANDQDTQRDTANTKEEENRLGDLNADPGAESGLNSPSDLRVDSPALQIHAHNGGQIGFL